MSEVNLNNEACKLSGKITIGEIMQVLHVADIRTAIKWCKSKSICILKLGKQLYVNTIDFELIIDRPFIESLKTKYPESWKEIYEAYKKNDYKTILEKTCSTSDARKQSGFMAPGAAGNNFIDRISRNTK